MAWQELCDLQWSTAAQDEMTSASFTAHSVSSRRCCRETKSTVRYCWQEDYPWCVHCPRPGQKQIQSPVNNIKAATVCRCVQMWRYQNERYSELQEVSCRTRAQTHEDVNGAQDCLFFEGIIKSCNPQDFSLVWFGDTYGYHGNCKGCLNTRVFLNLEAEITCQEQHRGYRWEKNTMFPVAASK